MNFEPQYMYSFCILETGDFCFLNVEQQLLTVGVLQGTLMYFLRDVSRTYTNYLHTDGKELVKDIL